MKCFSVVDNSYENSSEVLYCAAACFTESFKTRFGKFHPAVNLHTLERGRVNRQGHQTSRWVGVVGVHMGLLLPSLLKNR